MGFYNRPYYGGGRQYGGGMGSAGSMFGSNLTPVVKWLLLINTGVFILQTILHARHIYPEEWFATISVGSNTWWQVWRLITFQFLHANFGHLFGNMLTLFFFGHVIERSWGSRKILKYYLTCGAVGALVFLLGSAITPKLGGVLVGASGGILGIMTAGAILFPQMSVFLFPIPIPIKIRIFLMFYLIWFIVNVSQVGWNAGGDLCHLGGMAAGFIWIMGQPFWQQLSRHRRQQVGQRRHEQQTQLQYEVDRILAKVHQQGIHSLTRKEKQILQDATEHQRQSGS